MYQLATLTTGLLLFASSAFAQSGGGAGFEGLGDLPGGEFNSRAEGVTADGSLVVGMSESANGTEEAFVWTEEGGMVGLGDLPGGDFFSWANGVADDDSMVIGYSLPGENPEAFRWDIESDTLIGLGDLPGGNVGSVASGVSANGAVVGWSYSERGAEAFRWTEDGGWEGLGDLPEGIFNSWARGISPDGSVVVGEGSSEEGREAFRWEAATDTMAGLGDLPGGIFHSIAFGVSADGSVVVGQSNSDDGYEAFRWTEEGGMIGLGDFPGGIFNSAARDVSADGSLVVGYSGASGGSTAFRWTEGEGMRDLKEVLETDYGLDLTGWELIDPREMSSDGTVIVGYGINPDGNIEAWKASGLFPISDEESPETLTEVLSAPRPNPVRKTATLTLTVERAQEVIVEVVDVLGRRVQTLYEEEVATQHAVQLQLDASTLPAGIYVLRAVGEDFTKTQQLTVVR